MDRTSRNRTLANLRRRLDRYAIAQLRDHQVELLKRIDELESRVEALERALCDASSDVDFWCEHARELALALSDDSYATHRSVGLTQDGRLLIIRRDDD
jgi:predicted  nucleic acid-binding Zn-ribbon protein